MIALSTAWYSRSKPSVGATLEAVAKMGFEAVEIGVSDALPFRLKELQKALKSTPLRVVSVHNICSERKLDPTNRRGDWLASPDEEQRGAGVAATLDTIENARALGASAVVLHLGSPPIELRWEKQSVLYQLMRGGPVAEERLGVSREELLAERAEAAPGHFEAACRSLAELLERSSGTKLGVECRMGWHELPNLDELSVLLERFPDPRVGYWHDVGHAVIQDFLGLADQHDWLRRHRDRTIGVHLHDVRERTRDHYPPGLGEVDFEPLAGLLPPGALWVMEISADFIAEEIALGKRHLEEAGFCG
ncbi:MAG: sugar phosphate isomerase/epimerase [Planctomycetes bacterium]|nr:sugar phosphate isomerase/epimerase [Planctomycetota bacterium]